MATKILNRPNIGFAALLTGAALFLGYVVFVGVPAVQAASGNTASCVTLLGNDSGVQMGPHATGNFGYGRVIENTDYTVDAINNFWGSAVGPGHQGPGSLIPSYVGFQPNNAGGQELGCDFAASPTPAPAPTIIGVTATPNILWAPDHTMVAVSIAVEWDKQADQAVSCSIISISISDRINDLDSNTGEDAPKGMAAAASDWVITGGLSLELRAERFGDGPESVYTIGVGCVDYSGRGSGGEVYVTIPHNYGKEA